jgi:hypothetical protein
MMTEKEWDEVQASRALEKLIYQRRSRGRIAL